MCFAFALTRSSVRCISSVWRRNDDNLFRISNFDGLVIFTNDKTSIRSVIKIHYIHQIGRCVYFSFLKKKTAGGVINNSSLLQQWLNEPIISTTAHIVCLPLCIYLKSIPICRWYQRLSPPSSAVSLSIRKAKETVRQSVILNKSWIFFCSFSLRSFFLLSCPIHFIGKKSKQRSSSFHSFDIHLRTFFFRQTLENVTCYTRSLLQQFYQP